MTERVDPASAMQMATDIVIAFLGQRAVEPEQLPELVQRVRSALMANLDDAEGIAASDGVLVSSRSTAAPLKPAVPIEQSVTPDYLISLEDGKPYRSLRRHLMARYKMTPDDYRRKWNLPADYPMVAPSYAEDRSRVAKRIGLGKRG